MSLDILKEDLKNKTLRNLYLFYGPEEYLKRFYMHAIEEILLEGEYRTFNKITLEGKVETEKIIEATETMPLFSEKKMVIVKNTTLLKSKKKTEEEVGKNKPKNDDFLGYLQNIPSYTCVVFSELEIDKRMKAIDTIKKNGLIVEFPFQKPAELVKWVMKGFKSFKKEINPMVASELVENSEQGMHEILNEINKVVLFVGDRREVCSKDIQEVCTKSIKSRIFDLTDAISEKKPVSALKLLNDMVVLKEPLPKILFMITRQFRQVLEMKLLNEKGILGNEAASKMGISPYAASKIQKQTRTFSVALLKMALEESLTFDLAIKTGKLNDRMAVELLISKFAK